MESWKHFLLPITKKSLFGKYKYEEPSVFPFEEMVVSSKTPFAVDADGKISKETKIKIRLAKKRGGDDCGKRETILKH
jgi:hypothetical protein